jgi:DNA-binding transcriptional ArsR family regulator
MPDVDVFAALANPVRREILMRLRKGPRGVGDLTEGFDIGRPAVSEHLQVLRKARLIREEPRGRERYYHLDPRPLSEVSTWMAAFERYWKQRLVALEAVLNEQDEQKEKRR